MAQSVSCFVHPVVIILCHNVLVLITVVCHYALVYTCVRIVFVLCAVLTELPFFVRVSQVHIENINTTLIPFPQSVKNLGSIYRS